MPLGKLDDWEALPRPATRTIMDNVGCSNPECKCKPGHEPMVIINTCHPGHGFNLFYFDGVLTSRCDECKDVINQYELAR